MQTYTVNGILLKYIRTPTGRMVTLLYACDTGHEIMSYWCPVCEAIRDGEWGPFIDYDDAAIEFGGNDS